jgi:hypothetical protein
MYKNTYSDTRFNIIIKDNEVNIDLEDMLLSYETNSTISLLVVRDHFCPVRVYTSNWHFKD